LKRFQFPLQAVHNLRESLRDEAERNHAEAAAKVRQAAAELEEARRVREAATEAHVGNLQTGAINPHDLALRANYLTQLVRDEFDACTRLAALEREREARQQALVKATRDTEATAKLRERYGARHQAELRLADQNALDELAMLATAHRSIHTRDAD
jgi:flagellar export protein FliJ